jgi:hypothetical protein
MDLTPLVIGRTNAGALASSGGGAEVNHRDLTEASG